MLLIYYTEVSIECVLKVVLRISRNVIVSVTGDTYRVCVLKVVVSVLRGGLRAGYTNIVERVLEVCTGG
jgi:hypothetical protein